MALQTNKDPEVAKKLQELAQYFSTQEIEDLKQTLNTLFGLRVIARLFRLSKPLTDPNTGTAQTYWNCGARAMGLTFLNDIVAHCPEKFLEILAEERKREERINQVTGGKS